MLLEFDEAGVLLRGSSLTKRKLTQAGSEHLGGQDYFGSR